MQNKNWQGSRVKLRRCLDNIFEHFENNRQNCSVESWCRRDQNYEPPKNILSDSDAGRILKTDIYNLQIYKTQDDYVNCIDTHFVESFNNALTYHVKRIKFGDKE